MVSGTPNATKMPVVASDFRNTALVITRPKVSSQTKSTSSGRRTSPIPMSVKL